MDLDLTPTVVTPHGLAQLVPCPLCHAPPGTPCTTRTNHTAAHAHRQRWDASSASAAHDVAVFIAKTDDTEWRAGDHLIGKAYRWDNDKITVLQVLRNGTDPQRNAYRQDVSVVRVLAPAEALVYTS